MNENKPTPGDGFITINILGGGGGIVSMHPDMCDIASALLIMCMECTGQSDSMSLQMFLMSTNPSYWFWYYCTGIYFVYYLAILFAACAIYNMTIPAFIAGFITLVVIAKIICWVAPDSFHYTIGRIRLKIDSFVHPHNE